MEPRNQPRNQPLDRDVLIEQNTKLVYHALTPLFRRYPDLSPADKEDVEAAGFLGLCHAADRFHAERGRAFSTFAYVTIQGEAKKALARQIGDAKARRAGVVVASLDAPVAGGEGTATVTTLMDTLTDPDPKERPGTALLAWADVEETTAPLHAWIKATLTEKQARTLWLHYGEGLTLRAIAEKQGGSYQNVGKCVKMATIKLQNAVSSTETGQRLAAALRYG